MIYDKGRRMKTLGIFGSGQLARMMALAVRPLGIDVICAGNQGDCAGDVATIVDVDMTDPQSVDDFLRRVDAATFETENIDVTHLGGGKNIYPPADVLCIGQNRLSEKKYFNDHGMQTAPYQAVGTLDDLQNAVATIGLPAILKTCSGGYDGKGQYVLKSPDDISPAWQELGGHQLDGQGDLILEGFVDFDYEVSLVGVRGRDGEKLFYPLTENVHVDGILHTSTVPSNAENLQGDIEHHMGNLMDDLNYVGVMAIEFFVKTDNDGVAQTYIANEMAPRVHNSGHWSMDGAITGQFENHVRAVMGLPLGDVSYHPSVMVNCIGTMPDVATALQQAGIKYHSYQKQNRLGRKVGHINMVGQKTIAHHYNAVLAMIGK